MTQFHRGCLVILVTAATVPPTLAGGVLRVHPSNARFFTDDSGRAIYLAGHQWFNDLQHNAWNHPDAVDWSSYLEFMQDCRLNYLRNWIVWSIGDPCTDRPRPLMPFPRTGPGKALDGQPKFDLTQFDPAFFDRMRNQLRQAQANGIYVSLMLFEVYGFMDRDGEYPRSLWAGNVFHGPNNRNDIDTDENMDGQGLEFFFTADPRVKRIQHDYVRKVIDTVNEFDNVFFEIANELQAEQWQLEMVRLIRGYEANKPKQHLIYLSPGGRDPMGKWSPLPKTVLRNSPADIYGVTRSWNRQYRGDPPVEAAVKPVIMDMDHVAADNDGNNSWNNDPVTPWKLLTRGYHQCMYDYDYWKPTRKRATWQKTRRSLGMARHYADKLPLATMHPRNDLSTTRYCLASPGRHYLVLQPNAERFTVQALIPNTRYDVEWYQIATDRVLPGITIAPDSESYVFHPPSGNAVLFMAATNSSQ